MIQLQSGSVLTSLALKRLMIMKKMKDICIGKKYEMEEKPLREAKRRGPGNVFTQLTRVIWLA